MSEAALFLGVDGGGTKTHLVCIDASGNERAALKIESTYHPEIGVEGVVRRLGEGVRTICGQVEVAPWNLAHVFFGLPAFGEDRTADAQLDAACAAILGHDRYRCDNDMVCGWAGSLDCEDGINIVAGTGSIGYGERQGRRARAGGWGEVFSDEGSAYWIAVRGLSAFSRMSDGLLPRGSLHGRFVAALSLDRDIDLCARVAGPPALSRSELAALAPIVCAAADDGDTEAQRILQDAADHLAAIARGVRAALGFSAEEQAALSWSGSILNEVTLVRTRFAESIVASGGFRFVAPRHTPAYGAALYARKLARDRDA
jgi:N-acetylglucosamine kinase-like BadF-type ATPase